MLFQTLWVWAGSCAIDFTQLGHQKNWNFQITFIFFYLLPKHFRCSNWVKSIAHDPPKSCWQVTSPPFSSPFREPTPTCVVASWPWCYVMFYWINDAKLCLQWGQILSRLFVGTYTPMKEAVRAIVEASGYHHMTTLEGPTTFQNFPRTKEPIKRRSRRLASIIYFIGFKLHRNAKKWSFNVWSWLLICIFGAAKNQKSSISSKKNL